MSKESTTLAQRIEATRIELGLSKTDIWKGAGLSSGVYSQWMNGQTLHGENLIKVAKILNVSPSWLQTGKGGRNQAVKEIKREGLKQEELEENTYQSQGLTKQQRELIAKVNKWPKELQETLYQTVETLDLVASRLNPSESRTAPTQESGDNIARMPLVTDVYQIDTNSFPTDHPERARMIEMASTWSVLSPELRQQRLEEIGERGVLVEMLKSFRLIQEEDAPDENVS